ncbi:hypothetical protein P8452_41899 [Trifolium repens]|nr:hypothetical protein P8452_41899 [Trifolium repens]
MNPSQTKSERHRQKRSERRRRRCLEKEAAAASTRYTPVDLPDDVIKEVLSFLPVKSLIRLKCFVFILLKACVHGGIVEGCLKAVTKHI